MTTLKFGIAAGAAVVMALGAVALTAKPNTVSGEATFDAAMASMSLAAAAPEHELICVERSESGTTEAFYFASRPVDTPDSYFSLTRAGDRYSLALLPNTSEHRSFNNGYYGHWLEGADRAEAQAAYDALRVASRTADYRCSHMADNRPNSRAYEDNIRVNMALEQ